MSQKTTNDKTNDKKEPTPAAPQTEKAGEKLAGSVLAVSAERTVADAVLNRLNELTAGGIIKLPKDYSAPNALKLAWLMLLRAKDKNDKPVLEVCTRPSIVNALLEMTIQGLNPAKKQGYFIAYGNQLEFQRSYQGSIAVAKRVAGVTDVRGVPIYQNDVFEYLIDKHGKKTLVKHEQKLENIDPNKVIGAYAVLTNSDGSTELDLMNIAQIRKAWQMGKGEGNTKAHQNFPDQMAAKTVIGRLCKNVINSSDDAALFADEDLREIGENTPVTIIQQEINDNANEEMIGLEAISENENAEEAKSEEDQLELQKKDQPPTRPTKQDQQKSDNKNAKQGDIGF